MPALTFHHHFCLIFKTLILSQSSSTWNLLWQRLNHTRSNKSVTLAQMAAQLCNGTHLLTKLLPSLWVISLHPHASLLSTQILIFWSLVLSTPTSNCGTLACRRLLTLLKAIKNQLPVLIFLQIQRLLQVALTMEPFAFGIQPRTRW